MLFAASRLYIGSDSGPMHVASLVGTPVVQLLGPTDPVENAPWSETPSRQVRIPVPCSPCRQRLRGRDLHAQHLLRRRAGGGARAAGARSDVAALSRRAEAGMIDLSIVVVTWNTRDLVLECLASIEAELRSAGRFCRASRPRPAWWTTPRATARSKRSGGASPGCSVVSLPRNVGFAAGSNAGLRALRGRHALLLNSDARLVRGVLARCVDYLDAHPDVGVVGPQLLNPDGSKQNSIHNFPMLATEVLPKGIFQFLFRRRFPSRRWAGDSPIDVRGGGRGGALPARAPAARGGSPPRGVLLLPGGDRLVPAGARRGLAGGAPSGLSS